MRRLIISVMAALAIFAGSTTSAEAKASQKEIKAAICKVFKSRCSEALTVAWCESRYNIHAKNGQYLGLFQMGNWARSFAVRTHYHGYWQQIRAAYRLFVATGRDWGQWECQP